MAHKNQSITEPGTESLPAAYGGPGWSPRKTGLKDDIGKIWRACGVSNEWGSLNSILLHRPGSEITQVPDINDAQFISRPDLAKMTAQHEAVAEAYRSAGVTVHYVSPETIPPPNLVYVADLLLMTPEGVIVGRPASTARAGEEVHISRSLAALGIPIIATIRGKATFEGADAAWLNAQTVLLGVGIRTNPAGADQLTGILKDQGVRVVRTTLPKGAMHLMGCLRFVDQHLAITRPGQIPREAIQTLESQGYQVQAMPSESEIRSGQALNFVTLGPRRVLAPEGTPESHAFFREMGIELTLVIVDEIIKCAGGIGCMTGILERGTT